MADSVSSRTRARGLSPLWEKDEEDEDWAGKRMPNMGQKTTPVRVFPSRVFGGSFVSQGHCDVSPPKVTSFGTLGGPNMFGEMSTSKRASKVPLGDRPDSLESSISTGATLVGLHVGQLQMDMPPVFTANR